MGNKNTNDKNIYTSIGNQREKKYHSEIAFSILKFAKNYDIVIKMFQQTVLIIRSLSPGKSDQASYVPSL